jgi:hypothetical protein
MKTKVSCLQGPENHVRALQMHGIWSVWYVGERCMRECAGLGRAVRW